MDIKVVRLDESIIPDFYKIHSAENYHEWCNCVAWWVESWEGWGDRTKEQNKAFRDELFAKGEFDGYLLYVNDVPVGWCQVGKRDRLKKLVEQFELEPDPEMWAITCFFIIPKYRKKKWATYMLRAVVADLYKQGVRKIESFPTRRPFPTAGDLWTGKESTYESVGFKLVRDHPTQPVMAVHYKRKVKEKESTSDESPQK